MSDNEKPFEAAAKDDAKEETLDQKEPTIGAEDPTDQSKPRPNSGGRKSLEGLSPQQDAKVGTLKQMFQDYDNEVLCSVLFEQCGGDLDKSIEAILEMQKVQNQGAGDAELKDSSQASSLAEPEEGSKEATAAKTEKDPAVDKASQELIDEMLAEEQQAILQAEEEAEEEHVRREQAMRQMEQRLLEEDLQLNRKQKQEGKGGDLLDKFSNKFKQGLSEFQGMFNSDEQEKQPQKVQKMTPQEAPVRPKTLREMVDEDSGVVEEYCFQLPQYSSGDSTLFSPRHAPGQQPSSDPPAGSFNLQVDNDEAIDLEHPGASSGAASTGSSSSHGPRNIQVHSAKRQNRGFTDGHVAVQEEYDDFDPDDELPRMQRALSDKMNSLRESFSSESGERVSQKMKDGGTRAAQKMKEQSAAAAEKMKAMSEKFKKMF